ncbi:MAG: NAD(P)/FAD-dependent oxidoreductase [Candidatus Zixiibacteriota bacterium]
MPYRKNEIFDAAVIGGGASGLLAAGRLANAGYSTLLLEKMSRLGTKLLITGGGRCNLSNDAPLEEFMEHFFPKRSGLFLRQALDDFSHKELCNLLYELGVETVIERGGRIFPKSQKSSDVLNALRKWTENTNKFLGASVSNIRKLDDDTFKIATKSGGLFYSRNVLVATGGASYPQTGTTGDGYEFARKLGHTITPLYPALVGLKADRLITTRIGYLDIKNIEASILVNGKNKKTLFGDMSFMRSGIGGPVILTLSNIAVEALGADKKVEVSIDLKPALSHEKLDRRLIREFHNNGTMMIRNILKNLLPQKLIQICLEKTMLKSSIRGAEIDSGMRERLRKWLKDFRMDISGSKSFSEAIITGGGISRDEIDPRTMQSRKVDGLYFSGEVIDINADTGGFNLQAAFSTGWMAAASIMKMIDPDSSI